METKAPIKSEMIEPAMAYIISRLWSQVEEARKAEATPEPYTPPGAIQDACLHLWLAVKAIDRLSTCCNMRQPGAVHFSIAAANERRRIADYIKDLLGFNPWFDDDHPTAREWNKI